jgi:16S rRNA (adenine1518-N6/adenine1519-N6)-dimethyltransferase
LHRHLAATLAAANPRLHLMEGDGVEHPLAGFDPMWAGCLHPAAGAASNPRREGTPPTPKPFKIVANLPYAIATPWLDGVLTGPLPGRMVLMLQQEAAQRYVAPPGTKNFGAISIFIQSAYAVAPRPQGGQLVLLPAAGHRVLPAAPRAPAGSLRFPGGRQGRHPRLFPAAAETNRRPPAAQAPRRGARPGSPSYPPPGWGPQTRPEQIPVALWRRLRV